MGKNIARVCLLLAIVLAIGATAPAATLTVPWIDGDFDIAPDVSTLLWGAASTTTFGDADGSGDSEAKVVGNGDGTYLMSRELTMPSLPGIFSIELDIETGSLSNSSFRMILLDLHDPESTANNLLNLVEPLYDVNYYFDDPVLDWASAEPISGHIVLNPAEANAYNIPGWDTMTAAQRTEYVTASVHVALVMYGTVTGDATATATLDNFVWSI